MSKIKIVEWNVSKRSEKREDITNSLKLVNPDIIVLTEVTFGIGDYKKYLGEYTCVEGLKESRDNKTIIFSKSNGVKEVELDKGDYSPNWSCVQVYDYTIMGVRFKNSGLTAENKDSQKVIFLNTIEEKKPDVIIGDFNVNSAFSIPGKYSWSAMLTEVKMKGYDYIDACNKEASFSYQRNGNLRALNIGTCPDVLFVRKESQLKALEAKYHWEEGCMTDHAMLIAELERKPEV